jgi:lipopolysaccharide biosynthesis protein
MESIGTLVSIQIGRCNAMASALVLIHVYHTEVWERIAAALHNLDASGFDLYINAVEGRTTDEWRQAVCREFPGAQIHLSPNLGQDIGGTLNLLQQIDLRSYDVVCKLHTKKSDYPGEPHGAWCADLLRACLDEPEEVFNIFEHRPEVTMIGSASRMGVGNGVNQRQCLQLCDRLQIDRRYAVSPWVAGCMFWCRTYIMQRLMAAGLNQREFVVPYGRDGTLAHAIERIFGALARSGGEMYWR